MSTTTRSRKPLQPASGTCRWLIQPGLLGTPGVLLITAALTNGRETSESYVVTQHDDGGRLVCYSLTKTDGTAYTVVPAADVWECDCPDYIFNRARATTAETRECKHCKATRKAVAELA
jgi:hypothetical protein